MSIAIGRYAPVSDASNAVAAAGRVSVAVCVPVRDERRRLPALLQALANQTEVSSFHVCLLFDGPQPVSQELAETIAHGAGFTLVCKSILRAEQPNAGRARRAALALGLAAINFDPGALLLTTDADTVPAADWIAASIRALKDADLVAGHIRRAAAYRMPERQRLEHYLERLYVLERTIDPIDYDPLPSHPSIGGASLGFRAGVYRALGGIDAWANKEDVLFVAAARKAGYRLRRDRSVRVTTSSRLAGRASHGLAEELRQIHAVTAAPRVEHPDDSLARYRQSAAARLAYNSGCPAALEALVSAYDMDLARVHAAVARAASADAFTLAMAASAPADQDTDLAEAEQILAQWEKHYLPKLPISDLVSDLIREQSRIDDV